MKILYTTDLHGNEIKYNYFEKVSKIHSPDIVINGGDMLPKNTILHKQGEFISTFLDKHFKFFNDLKIYYLCFLGNDDLKIFDSLFEDISKKYKYIIPLAFNKFEYKNYEFIGFNLVTDYPFTLKDRCRIDDIDFVFQKQLGKGIYSTVKGFDTIDDWISHAKTLPSIRDELENLMKPKDYDKAIYIIHMPPSKLGLDVCSDGKRVGSDAIYDFMLKYQPLISFHGHIHESYYMTGKYFNKLNKTLCFQPGQPHNNFFYIYLDTEKPEHRHIKINHK